MTLLSGSQKSFEIALFDDRDEPEDISGATAARFRVVADTGDVAGSTILDRSTSSSTLAINTSQSKLVGSFLSSADANLPAGRYVGQASLLIAGSWFHTDWFFVDILEKIAPNS